MDDAPDPAPRPRAQAALMVVPVVLIALGLPYALHLDLRASAAVTLGVLASAAFAASAMRRVLERDAAASGSEAAFLQLIATLPQGVLLLADGRIHVANPAARELLGLGGSVDVDVDTATLFDDGATASGVLDAAVVDRDVLMQRGDGGTVRVRLSTRDIVFYGRPMRLVLLADRTGDEGLAARLDTQRTELETLARRLMTVQEDERASLSRELHDDIGQAITAIKLSASSLAHDAEPRAAVVHETAQEIALIADQTVAKLRDLSLLLRPPQLDALGLEAALRWQAGVLFRSEYPKLELDIPELDCRPRRDVELACFRIAQEALTNVVRHARAGRVRLHLACDDVELRLRIEDDGCGVAPGHRPGLGLITMRERARQLGGRLTLDSRPGRTCVEATLPLPTEGDARSGLPQG